ncbi:nucleotide-diphospho-sugar transferase [Fimicolochytrium jonesii]|uniref:nucleotide-diphospho-sugar transferase n=1 Tax=Fimicolochytrium jonesii TaxID=1396493 RepID=UPI0022FDF267|nr:nucleotide-diphospho-sugar transferase [Fimicolochytrium jonesii]KAI8824264.1 nucleotide-diphospho-sugar transferase [Fimicolochytrium jonesii]
MKALILVGGFGTRLRPLTLTLPKPLVEFANRPMILHQIEALVKAGVTDIVLAVNYRPEVMASFMQKYEEEFKVRITFSIENEPLGTAGPLALAKDVLGKDNEPFFVLNSDVICDFPFHEMAAAHKAHGGEGTILVTKVEDPSKYGVVVNKPDSTAIERFVEKPTIFVSNKINAGIYIFNPSILNRIQPIPTSIEKEIFPAMAAASQLHTMDLPGFWMDVGQPKDYLTGTGLYLKSLHKSANERLATGPHINGFALIDKSAKIGENCKIGPHVVIGPDCVIGNGVRLSKCAILEGAEIKDHANVTNTIVGWHSTVGRWAWLEGVTVLGDDVHVADEVFINGGCVLPHKTVSSNIAEPSIIM